MTSLKTSIKTITNLSDTNCLEIHGASLFGSSASGTKKELVIMFDGDKVQRYSISESPVSTKNGVFK